MTTRPELIGKRLVILTGDYPPVRGGVSAYAANLAGVLTQAGLDVVVITGQPGKGGRTTDKVIDLTGHGLSWRIGDANAVADLVTTLSPDVVSLQYVPHMYGRRGIAPGIALVPTLIHQKRECLMLCTLHELGVPFEGSLRRITLATLHNLQLRALIRPFTGAIVTNPWDRQRISRLASGKQIRQLPVGSTIPVVSSSADHRSQVRKLLGVRDGEVLVADFNPFSWAKCPEVLIEVLESIPNTRLLLVGGMHADPVLRERFVQRAERFQDRVSERSGLDDVELSFHLQAADIYLHTAIKTGASSRSTTLATALAHALPTVAFLGRETPKEFQHAAGISLVKVTAGPAPWLAFVAAVRDIAASSALRTSMAAGALEVYEEQLAWSRIGGGYLDLMEG